MLFLIVWAELIYVRKGEGETVKPLEGRRLTGQAAGAVGRVVTWRLEDTKLQRVREKENAGPSDWKSSREF